MQTLEIDVAVIRSNYATKADLTSVREEMAVQFGKVHTDIAQLEATLIKWFVATAVAVGGLAFAIGKYVA